MALEDLFNGMKAGRDMYFDTEDSANRLAAQRLKLAADEQIYADDQYLKPSQLADRLARYQYNEALSKANTNTLSKLRPLQDTLNAAKTNLGISQTDLKQEGFDQTRGTRLAEILATAGNDFNKQTTVIPAQQRETVARANLNTSNDTIKSDINRLSRGDQVLTGVNSNLHKANEAQADAAESSQYMQWAKQNPEAFKRYNQDKINAATQTAREIAINSLSGVELAEASRIANNIDAAIRTSGVEPDAFLEGYFNSPDASLRNGAALYQKNKRDAEQEMALEVLKNSQPNAAQIKQENRSLAGALLFVNPQQLASEIGAVQLQDGNYKLPQGGTVNEETIRQLAAQQAGVLPDYMSLRSRQMTLNNGGVSMPSINYGN